MIRKNNIYIRVDGDEKIGLGHIYRAFSLGEILNKEFNIIFVLNENSKLGEKVIKEKFKIYLIREEIDFFKKLEKSDIVILDGYHFSAAYYGTLTTLCHKIISIQDIEIVEDININLIINHLPGMKVKYRNHCLLAGPEYAILRKEVLEKPLSEELSDKYFISLGGTINYFLINKIIEYIRKTDSCSEILILTTDENKPLIVGEGLSVFTNVNGAQVVNLIDSSSICFITSGMILYEVLARNRKAVVGALNQGQFELGVQFQELQLVEFVGMWNQVLFKNFKEALKVKGINASSVQNLFDRKSGDRILKSIQSL